MAKRKICRIAILKSHLEETSPKKCVAEKMGQTIFFGGKMGQLGKKCVR